MFDAFSALGSVSGAIGMTAVVYGCVALLTFFLTPFVGNLMQGGVRSVMTAGSLSYAFALSILGLLFVQGEPSLPAILLGLFGFALFMALYRVLYFVPYSLAEHAHRARSAVFELLIALLPAGAGFMIISYPHGYFVLFTMSVILALMSLVPLASIDNVYERFSWRYGTVMQSFVAHSHRRLVSGTILDGFHGAGLLFLWPIAAFLLLAWSYPRTGMVLTITLLVLIAFREWMHRARLRHDRALRFVALSSWVVRFSAFSPVTIILADVMYHATAPRRAHGADLMIGEHQADEGLYVDEYTALKEMGIALGKFLFALTTIVLTTFAPFDAIFITALALAAVAAFGSHYLSREKAGLLS